MGTFHNDKSALHGITVVVDTKGPNVYVGRCDDEDDQQVILVDVDVHEEGQNGKSKAQFIERVAKFGHWKKHDHLVVPRNEVTSIKRLGDMAELLKNTPAPVATQSASAVPQSLEKKADPAANAVVTLTPSAQVEVKRLIAAEGKADAGLRLGVKGGGCSGFSYKLEFDRKKEGDVVVSYDGLNVYLDRKSVVYLRGITLDYQKGLSGKGFVFHNPNATNTCGCGESFAV